MRIKTKDLYCGAYILSQGGTLEEARLSDDGRKGRPSVTFIFAGENVKELTQEFLGGRAHANLASFKVAINQLKEVMFDLIDGKNERIN